MKPGEEIEPLVRTLGAARLVAYAGATWDWHRMHHDRGYVEGAGLPAPVVDGQMLGALVAEQLMDHFGPRAFVRELSVRYRSMVFAGQTVRCEGKVTAVDASTVRTEHRVVAGDGVGAEATATVVLG